MEIFFVLLGLEIILIVFLTVFLCKKLLKTLRKKRF